MSEKPTSPKPKSTKTVNKGEWTTIDTTGMTPEQVAQTAESLLATRNRRTNARHNDAQKEQKAGKTRGLAKENVQSGQKPAGKPKKAAAAHKPLGRPSDYSQELADRICAGLAEGKSLRRVCKDDNMPSTGTVCRWLTIHSAFQEQYRAAREAQADAMFEEMLEIADDGSNDTYEDGDGNQRVDHDHIARSKLRVHTRQWMIGKMKPKVYGDRLDVNHGGQADNPVRALLEQVNGTALKVKADGE